MIKQLYEKLYFESKFMLEYGRCKPIPDKDSYEYYQWDGNIDSIKNVPFLKDKSDGFKISGVGYGKYHLDYQEQDDVVDVCPGDYIVNKPDEYHGVSISIYSKEDFENKYIYR